MNIEVNARHKMISEAFREYARARAEKIGLQFPKVESVHVVLDFQHRLHVAEVIAQRKSETIVGKICTEGNIKSAMDMAAAKVERQLRKIRQKSFQLPVRKSAALAEQA